VPHERFLSDVLRVIGEYTEPDALDFYNLLDPYFMDMLDDVHGREDSLRGLVWGYRLLEAFPILKAMPDESFVERCFDQFVRGLEYREAELDVQELSTASAEHMTDDQAERIIALKRELETSRAVLDDAERALAEEAQAITSANRNTGIPQLRTPVMDVSLPEF
jgi:hypothetical protein